MRGKIFEILKIAVFILAATSASANANIVELDLFTLGCSSTYDYDSPYWTSDFDLGLSFTEISHVYMDWSGQITAGLAIEYDNPDEPFPLNVGIGASLGGSPYTRFADVWGGQATYPNPEPFDYLSEFELLGNTTWSDLLDGQGTITINYKELIMMNGKYVEHGSISLDSATLVVDGVIVPEPVSILLFAMGALYLRAKYPAHRFKP